MAVWNKVFYIAAGVYVLGTLIFMIFGRTSVQPWNTHWIKKSSESTPLLAKNDTTNDSK